MIAGCVPTMEEAGFKDFARFVAKESAFMIELARKIEAAGKR